MTFIDKVGDNLFELVIIGGFTVIIIVGQISYGSSAIQYRRYYTSGFGRVIKHKSLDP